MCRKSASVEIGNKMENKRPKVLHVLKSSIYSGAENVVINIIKKLSNEFDFNYIATDGQIRKQLEQSEVAFTLLERFNRRELVAVIERFHPDIIHAHDFAATILCATISGRFRLISHLHYDPPWVRKWNLKTCIYMVCARRVSQILTVSGKAYNNMVFSDRLRNKCSIVGNPIDIDKIKRLGSEGNKMNSFDLIFVGRLVEQKNPQRFLKIVRLLQDRQIFVTGVMLGNGELKVECEKLLEAYNLRRQVRILGFQQNPYKYMKSARILCMTSRWEGYGLVALEANILGVPVLSSRTAGVEEILGEEAPELCDTDEEFAEKIATLLGDKEVYEQWGNATHTRVSCIEDIKDYMNKISSIYQEIL